MLVVIDWLGLVKARAGDAVRLGGGEFYGRWHACGLFQVRAASGAGG